MSKRSKKGVEKGIEKVTSPQAEAAPAQEDVVLATAAEPEAAAQSGAAAESDALGTFEWHYPEAQVRVAFWGEHPSEGETKEQLGERLRVAADGLARTVTSVFGFVTGALEQAETALVPEPQGDFPLSPAPADWEIGARCSLPLVFEPLMLGKDQGAHPLLRVHSYYRGEFILVVWADTLVEAAEDGRVTVWESTGVNELLDAYGLYPNETLPRAPLHAALWRYTHQHHQPDNTAVPRLVAHSVLESRAGYQNGIQNILKWCFPQALNVGHVLANYPWMEGLKIHPAYWKSRTDGSRFAFLGIPYGILIDVLPNAVRVQLHVVRPQSVDANLWVDADLRLQMESLGVVAEAFDVVDVQAACEYLADTPTMQAVMVMLKAGNGTLADLLSPRDRAEYEERKAKEAARVALKAQLVKTYGVRVAKNGEIPALGPDIDLRVIREGMQVYREGEWRWCSIAEVQNLPGARVRVTQAGGPARVYVNLLNVLRGSGCEVTEVTAPAPTPSPAPGATPADGLDPQAPVRAFRVEMSPLAHPSVEGQA